MPSRRCPSRHVHRRPVIRFLPRATSPSASSSPLALRLRSPNTPPLEYAFIPPKRAPFSVKSVEGGWLPAVSSVSDSERAISRGEDPKRARMQGGSSGIVYGGLKYQASSSSGAFWNLLEQPPLTHWSSVVVAGAVHRGRSRRRWLHHLPRRDSQPQGGERGASLAQPWGRAASAGVPIRVVPFCCQRKWREI